MTWLTLRQFRVPALSVLLALVAVGVVLAITGPELVGRTDFSDLEFLYGAMIFATYLLPAGLGIFWGVPVVAREVETGTHSLVWNQTVTRGRWLAFKLGVGLLASMAVGGVLSLAVSWWASPIDALASTQSGGALLPRIAPLVFGARGIAPIGYAAFAFVLGVAVGILLRRTVAAMAVALVVFAAVQVAVPFLVRPYVLPATEETVTLSTATIMGVVGDTSTGVVESVEIAEPPGTWVLANETVDLAGNVVSPLPVAVHDCLPRPGQGKPVGRGNAMECVAASLPDDSYRQRLTYHEGDRFWPLQWIETAMFLALSGLLTWFCLRRVRRLS